MTLIAAFLVAHLGIIISALFGAGGILFGMFRHQQAKSAIAGAKATVAANNAALADSNAAASAAATQSVENASAAEQSAAATPDDQVDAELAKLGALRKGE